MPQAMQFMESPQNFLAAAAIQRPCRLIRENRCCTVHQGARDADALLLTAGQLIRAVVQAVPQSKLLDNSMPRGAVDFGHPA